MPLQFRSSDSETVLAFLQAFSYKSLRYIVCVHAFRRAIVAVGCKLNMVDMVGQVGADLEISLSTYPLLLYTSQLYCIGAARRLGRSNKALELFVDALKISLQVVCCCLDKISVCFEAFGCERGLATKQDKEMVSTASMILGDRVLQGCVCEGNDNRGLIPSQ